MPRFLEETAGLNKSLSSIINKVLFLRGTPLDSHDFNRKFCKFWISVGTHLVQNRGDSQLARNQRTIPGHLVSESIVPQKKQPKFKCTEKKNGNKLCLRPPWSSSSSHFSSLNCFFLKIHHPPHKKLQAPKVQSNPLHIKFFTFISIQARML